MYNIFNLPRRTDFALRTEVNEIADVSMSQERISIIHSDAARSNQRELSVMKGGHGMSIQILNFLAPGVPCSARARFVPISHRTSSVSVRMHCSPRSLLPYPLLPDRVTELVMADLSQDGDEWSSFDHVVEMKHCAFLLGLER